MAAVCMSLTLEAWLEAMSKTVRLIQPLARLGCLVALLGLASACLPLPQPQPKRDLVDLALPPGLRSTVEQPGKVTLYTICHPLIDTLGDSELNADEAELLPAFDDEYKVLGSVNVSAEEGQALIDSFKTAVSQGQENGVMCFIPHHAIRVESAGRIVDILVCFKCYNYKVNPGGGYNNVVMSNRTGMEVLWRSLVAKYRLRDITTPEE